MQTWFQAWSRAGGLQTGVDGLVPAEHYRTAVMGYADVLADVVLPLAEGLRRQGRLRHVVDVGAGDGELLAALGEAARSPGDSPAASYVSLRGVDLGPRPKRLPAEMAWHQVDIRRAASSVIPPRSLVILHEVLDDVPAPVVELDDAGRARVVLVSDDGTEALGPRADADALAWLQRWWPLRDAGQRAEVGSTRDAVLRAVAWACAPGAVLVVDYGHTRTTRPFAGSLQGYRRGRRVSPVPDGRTAITAGVAFDALIGAIPTDLPRATITSSQAAVLSRTSAGGRRGLPVDLVDPFGWGGFRWLLVDVG